MVFFKIARFIFYISLIFFSVPFTLLNAQELNPDPERQRASVRLYTNEKDGTLWVQIKPFSEYKSELLVYLPDGEVVYLVLSDQIIIPQLENFFSQKEFNFPARKLIGIYFDNGKPYPTEVFEQEGVYNFYFAENIETEPENTFYEYVKVTYLLEQRARCQYTLAGFGKDILKQIPLEMVLSQEYVSDLGEIRIEIEGAENFILSYEACVTKEINLTLENIKPQNLNSIFDFSRTLILNVVPGIGDILKDLIPYLEKKTLNLEINSYDFSTLKFEAFHNREGSVNIEIKATGE